MIWTPEMSLDVWYQALKEEIGVVIPVVDPKSATRLSSHIYTARADINDQRLKNMTCHVNGDGKHILIYHKLLDCL